MAALPQISTVWLESLFFSFIMPLSLTVLSSENKNNNTLLPIDVTDFHIVRYYFKYYDFMNRA